MIKVSLKEILKSDVGILNKYFLVTLILVLLTIVGYTSYALFSYEEISSTSIRLKYTGEQPMPDNNLSTNWKDKTTNELKYKAVYTLTTLNLPETYSYNGTNYTLNKTIDVSEQENNSVLLGEYKNGSNIIAVFGQEGGVVAPANSKELFALSYEDEDTGDVTTGVVTMDLSNLLTNWVVNMEAMFQELEKLTSLNLSNWNTSKVANMNYMFHDCLKLTTLDLTTFDTRNVTTMKGMFLALEQVKLIIVGCNFIIGESTITTLMFNNCYAGEVTNVCAAPNARLTKVWKDFTTNELKYLGLYTINTGTLPSVYMHSNKSYTLSTTLDVSERQNGTVLLGEYKNGSNIIAVLAQEGGVVAPTNSSRLFALSYEDEDTGDVTTSIVTMDLSNLNTSYVTNMKEMFQELEKLTSLDVSNFDTTNVTNMDSMFHDCLKLPTLDISSFNTTNVTDMKYMFAALESVQTITVGCNFVIGESTITTSMFNNCNASSVTKVCKE